MLTFHIDGLGLGNLAAVYFTTYFIIQLFVGPLLDRFSPKYLTSIAILTCAIGAFLFSCANYLLTAEIARGLMGAGAAFATVSYMKMSTLWFRSNQVAFIDGLLATAAMTGALCSQVPLAMLVNRTDWRSTLLYCSILGFILAFLFFFIVKDKKNTTNLTNSFLPKIRLTEIFRLFKIRQNWLLTFYSGLVYTPISVIGGLWGNPFFEVTYHLTKAEAASYTSLVFLGLAIGGPCFGFLADRVNDRIKVMIYGTIIAFITLTSALYITALPLWLFGIILFIFGFGVGSFMSCYAVGKSLNNIYLAGTVVALINTGDALFSSFSEPLVGKILDIFWDGKIINGIHSFSPCDYRIALSILPIYLILAIICLLQLKKQLHYNKITAN
jgi:MFS family permease